MKSAKGGRKRTVLITGCSEGGIGYELVLACYESGLCVFATARDISKMVGLSGKPGIHLVALDVTSEKSIKAARDVVENEVEGLDYLINNAGEMRVGAAVDTPVDQARHLFDVNYWGPVVMNRYFARLVIARKGTIVHIGSIAAGLHKPFSAYYSASKAALQAYSETLRLELAPFGANVWTVVLGIVATNILAKNNVVCPLPSDSFFRQAEEGIRAAGSAELTKGGMPASTLAHTIVDAMLRKRSGLSWEGKWATVGRLLGQWAPQRLLDILLMYGTGLNLVRTISK